MSKIAMNASFGGYAEILTSHQQNPSSPDNLSSLLVGYRNGYTTKKLCENNGDSQQQQQHQHQHQHQQQQQGHLAFAGEVPNGFNNQQLMDTNVYLNICAGCGEKITDRYLLEALDRHWHNSCLKCHCCGAMLADVGQSCFTKRGMILCKKDYFSMFGCSGVCSGCGETIPPNEMVAKTNNGYNNAEIQKPNSLFSVFHLKCFACAKCGSNLRPGDRYTMLGATLICEQDWQKIAKDAQATSNCPIPTRKGKVGRPRRTKD